MNLTRVFAVGPLCSCSQFVIMDIVESVSKRTFSGSSGTYNVQALELAAARERNKLKGFNITVRFLDDTEHEFHVPKRSKGAVLMDLVYQHLELVEKDYFGLQYSENGCAPNVNKPELMVLRNLTDSLSYFRFLALVRSVQSDQKTAEQLPISALF